jgi:hypothetical protein
MLVPLPAINAPSRSNDANNDDDNRVARNDEDDVVAGDDVIDAVDNGDAGIDAIVFGYVCQ